MSVRQTDPPSNTKVPTYTPVAQLGTVRHAQFSANGMPAGRLTASTLKPDLDVTASKCMKSADDNTCCVEFNEVVNTIDKTYTPETVAAFASADALVRFAMEDADLTKYEKNMFRSGASVARSAAQFSIMNAQRKMKKYDEAQVAGLSKHINGILTQDGADTGSRMGNALRKVKGMQGDFKAALRDKARMYYEKEIKKAETKVKDQKHSLKQEMTKKAKMKTSDDGFATQTTIVQKFEASKVAAEKDLAALKNEKNEVDATIKAHDFDKKPDKWGPEGPWPLEDEKTGSWLAKEWEEKDTKKAEAKKKAGEDEEAKKAAAMEAFNAKKKAGQAKASEKEENGA